MLSGTTAQDQEVNAGSTVRNHDLMVADLERLEKQIAMKFSEFEERSHTFLDEQIKAHQAWDNRLIKLEQVFDDVDSVWRSRLELLATKFGDRVKATAQQTRSTRDATFAFRSNVARIELRFRATTDSDIHNVVFQYDLRIIPVLMRFDSHAEIEFPP